MSDYRLWLSLETKPSLSVCAICFLAVLVCTLLGNSDFSVGIGVHIDRKIKFSCRYGKQTFSCRSNIAFLAGCQPTRKIISVGTSHFPIDFRKQR